MPDFTVLDCEQRSTEWHQARLGRLCSSHANDMLAAIQKGEAAARRNLRVRLMLERVTGKTQDSDYVSHDMQNGIDREAEALKLYEAVSGVLLCHSGFVLHPTLQAGWSPDGHTLDWTGFVEVKAPKAATHLETLKTRTVPTEYLRQMTHGGFWIGGAEWGDYVSYCPDFPEHLQLSITRVHRRDLAIGEYEAKAKQFLEEVNREVAGVLGWRVLQEAV